MRRKMKKTILLRVTIAIIIQALLLLEANCVHAQDITYKNHPDTLSPAMQVQGENLENGLYQLYHILRYTRFWDTEQAEKQQKPETPQAASRPKTEGMPKSKNIVQHRASSLTHPDYTYSNHETEPTIERIAEDKPFTINIPAAFGKQRKEIFTAQTFLIISILGAALTFIGQISTVFSEPFGLAVMGIGLIVGTGFSLLTIFSFFIDLFINYHINKQYYLLPPVQIPNLTVNKSAQEKDALYNFWCRLGIHQKLSPEEFQLAPEYAKDLRIIGRQSIQTDELGKVTVYFANSPDVRKNPAFSSGRAIHVNGQEKKIYIFLNYLQHELHTKILPYLQQGKIRIPAQDLMSILLSDADLSTDLFALILVYPQMQKMLLKRPLNDYLHVIRKKLGELYSIEELQLKINEDITKIAQRNGNSTALKAFWEKKFHQYSLPAKIREDETEILNELELLGFSFKDYSTRLFKRGNIERDDTALEHMLNIVAGLENIDRFLRHNLRNEYRENPLLIQKELIYFTFDLTDHRVPLELIYSLIGREFSQMSNDEILQVLVETTIIRHLGRMYHETLGVPAEDYEPDILWMLKHNVPLFLTLKNPLRAVLAGKNGNGTFTTIAKLLGKKPYESGNPFAAWLQQSGILELNTAQRKTLQANAEMLYEKVLENRADYLKAKQQKKADRSRQISAEDKALKRSNKPLDKLTDTSLLLNPNPHVLPASLSILQAI